MAGVAICGRSRLVLESVKFSHKCVQNHLLLNMRKSPPATSRTFAVAVDSAKDVDFGLEDDEFRVLVIPGYTELPAKRKQEQRRRKEIPPARYNSMSTGQDWTSVWPSASTFKWSVVPFPVRQGMAKGEENDGIPPGKYANAELMKIPNFLHLTPAHIKQQCAAIKQFCTPWPEGLDTDDDCDTHFPVQVTSRTYVVDSPSVHDMRARVVTLKLKLSTLELDAHAKDKLLRLVGNRYDPKTDTLAITTDRCPLRKQNYDYSVYLLTALYHESQKYESWESEKTVADMETYVWEIYPSYQSLVNTVRLMKRLQEENSSHTTGILSQIPDDIEDDDSIASLPPVQDYATAVTNIHNNGETEQALEQYKQCVISLLLAPPPS